MTTILPPLVLDKIFIVDFDDSFTYNIASVVYPEEKSCVVIRHDVFFRDYFPLMKKIKSRHAVILGPGPGHPEEYREYFSDIARLLDNESIYVLGICLGHQILGMVKNLEIREVKNKIHGESVEINFFGKFCNVQRYNSLGVFEGPKELISLQFSRGISYQFHPESIGTDDNLTFFLELLKFVHQG